MKGFGVKLQKTKLYLKKKKKIDAEKQGKKRGEKWHNLHSSYFYLCYI